MVLIFPYESEQIHGISTALAQDQGVSLATVLDNFLAALAKAQYVVGHNGALTLML